MKCKFFTGLYRYNFSCIKVCLTLCLLLVLEIPASSKNIETEELVSLNIEELMGIRIITASKKSQKAVDSPLPVIVIDEEEIRLSGEDNIPDLLRRLAGIDVLTISASDRNVSIRGFGKESSRTVLVMIDSRPVYLDFYNVVLWDALPISMEEIRKIEVVKGPGSSVYGGNAFNGIINIITKTPDEIDGTVVSVSGGENDSFTGSLIYGTKKGPIGYKMAFSRDEKGGWEEGDSKRDSTSGNFMIGKDLAGGSTLSLSGSINESEGETFTALDNFIRESTQSHLMLEFKGTNDMNLKLFWNRLDTTLTGEKVLPTLEALNIFNQHAFEINTDAYEIEATKLLKTENIGSILLGGNLRRNSLDSDLMNGAHEQDIYGLFIEDEVEMRAGTKAVIGGRYDHHPLVKGNFSPRLGLVHEINDDHHVRVSYTKAYGLPSFTQSYIYLERGVPFTTDIVGNTDLDVEKITSWNLGYSGSYLKKVEIKADIFHNIIKDVIRWPKDLSIDNKFRNRDAFRVWGGEFNLKIRATDTIDFIFNYAYLDIDYSNSDEEFSEHPESKVNAGLNYSREKIFGSIFAHYVGKTRWTAYKTSLTATYYEYSELIDDYTIVNANAGYRFNGNMEMSVHGSNLFNKRHKEYCMGDTIGRKIMGKATYRF